MGFETNDDAATGLPLACRVCGDESDNGAVCRHCIDSAPVGLPLVMTGPDSTRRLAVIRDEQRMVDLFRECALAVAAMRAGVQLLDNVTLKTEISERFKTAIRLESSATALESAISRANGGAA